MTDAAPERMGEAVPERGALDRSALGLAPTLLVCGAVAYAVGLLLVGRALSWDELEFFHATDAVARGQVPFRDFYEHHAPLQWFLFAPVAAWLDGHGVSAVQALRWAQLPLWALTLFLLRATARLAGADARLATAAVVALSASSAFAHSAIEYRVDTVGTFFLVAGLALGLRADRRRASGLAIGALFACAALANLRLGPLLVVGVLLLALYSPSEGRWRANGSLLWMICGGLAALVPPVVYFALHRALGVAITRLFADNALADAALERHAGAFFDRAGALLGLSTTSGMSGWGRLLDLDAAGLVLTGLGLWGAVRALRGLRSGSAGAVVAVLLLTNLLFVLRMKAIYDYHFQVALSLLALAIPSLERAASPERIWSRLLFGAAALGLIVGFVNLWQRNLRPTLEYQDGVMAEVERAVPAGQAVFDGVGYALRRPPVRQDLWFLPWVVRVLVHSGRTAPLTVADLEREPPGAILFDARMSLWMNDWPEVRRWIVRHYTPYRQHVWLPGPSARLVPPAGESTWTSAATGDFRVVTAEALASHPWFAAPLSVGATDSADKSKLEVPLAALALPSEGRLLWSLDGVVVAAENGVLHLRRGQRIGLRWEGYERPVGLFLVPAGTERLFEMAPPGVDLDQPPRFRRLRASSAD